MPVPLWQQLTAVAQALQAIRGGQSGTAAVDAVEPRLRPGVQALMNEAWPRVACPRLADSTAWLTRVKGS